ncbi:MAG: NADH-quinone oxidoreductase subunit M, partial [Rickettsiales bacterium]
LSLSLILLTCFVSLICILVSIKEIKFRIKEYLIAFLLIESFAICIFSAVDVMLFYIVFEAILVPMFFVIGIWGGKNRIYASYKLFLYTITGSLLFLTAIIYIYVKVGNFDMSKWSNIEHFTVKYVELENNMVGDYNVSLLSLIESGIDLSTLNSDSEYDLDSIDLNKSRDIAKYLWIIFFIAFAIKIPMIPFHTWLPDAHVQAPTSGSIMLAGVMLKIGAYGCIRFLLLMLPGYAPENIIYALSIIAIIYASLIAFNQKDLKKIIAYSSISHMGFVTAGMFSNDELGFTGAIIQMISHGIISTGLFLSIGILYNQTHNRNIDDYGNVASKMPIYSAFVMILTMASIGLPGTSGFVGELMVIIGSYRSNFIEKTNPYALLLLLSMIFSAVYMLLFYKKIFYGQAKKLTESLQDIDKTEIIIYSVITFMILLLGIYPSVLTNVLNLILLKIGHRCCF